MLLLGVVAAVPCANAAVTTQLAFILDGSESISAQDWTTIREALAEAIEDPSCIRLDGSVELTVIQFSAFARIELGPTVVTETNAGDLADVIRGIPQMIGPTCISCGFCLAADSLSSSPHFDPQVEQILNLFTDGDPNTCSCDEASCGYEGTSCHFINIAREDAVCARDYALAQLSMTPDQDHIDAEFLGAAGEATAWLRDTLVWPQPGTEAPPFSPPGWVAIVESTDQLVSVFCTKCALATQPAEITVIKEVSGEPPADAWLFNGPHGAFSIPASGGRYGMGSLPPGEYTVTETPKDGYACTVDGERTNEVTVVLSADEHREITFVNTELIPDLGIEKTVDTPTPDIGDDVTFTVTVTNSGGGAASGVQVQDLLPSGYAYVSHTTTQGTYMPDTGAWQVGALAGSLEASLQIVATVLASGEHTNVARVDWEENTGDPRTDSATTAPRYPNVQLAKTVDHDAPEIGDLVTFTITVANEGEVAASELRITDVVPAGYAYTSHTVTQGSYANDTGQWDVGILAPASVASMTLTVTVLVTGDRVNVAIANWAENPEEPLTASATTMPVYPEPVLSKTVDRPIARTNYVVRFTVDISNIGPVSASEVEVADLLPDGYVYSSHDVTQGTYLPETGVWTVGTLDASASASLTLAAVVQLFGDRTNVATADWAENPGDPLTASVATESPLPPSGGSAGGNLTPIASAGKDQVVCVGETVHLDASHSYDPDGPSGAERISSAYTGVPRVFSDLFFQWSFTASHYENGQPVLSHPEGSSVLFTTDGFDSPFPSFVPDVPGDYVLSIIVSDATGAWSVDQVTIHAVVCTDSFACQYSAGRHLISLAAQPIDPSATAILDSSVSALPALAFDGAFVAADALSPVEGVWVRFTQDAAISFVGREVQEDVHLILERPGWHLISSPFPIAWEHVLVNVGGRLRSVSDSAARERIDAFIFCYDPLADAYGASSAIDPCNGYWVRTYAEDVLLVLPWEHRSVDGEPCDCGQVQGLDLPPKPGAAAPGTPDVQRLGLSAFPNPVSSSVTFRILRSAGVSSITLWVYDLAGEPVFHVPVTASATEVLWDLKTTKGEPVAAGLYFARLQAVDEASHQVVTSKVFRLLVVR